MSNEFKQKLWEVWLILSILATAIFWSLGMTDAFMEEYFNIGLIGFIVSVASLVIALIVGYITD